MEQHPIPQAITTYQFRLIGDMTLRQFSQLAGGVLVAFLFYSLPIVSFIKWFLVLFFVFLGFALAFLPLEDRPLDKWIVAFFKSIYSPTRFLWRKEKRIPDFLKEIPAKKAISSIPATMLTLTGTPQDAKTSLTEYFETFSVPTLESEIEKKERLALEKIEALFKTVKLPSAIIPQVKQIKIEEEVMPQIKIKPRKLSVPPSEPVVLKIGLQPLIVKEEKGKPKAKPKKEPPRLPRIIIRPKKKKGKLRVEAKTSSDLPIPTAPTQPNIIVGMILDREGKIIENAIVEIRDKDQIPVRALRSNRLGQFQIVTSLVNGAYEMEVEKEGFDFDIIKLNLTGEIIPPIEIRAR